MFIGKFSILIPAYKAQYLAECIDSILAQTYSNFELVIVNDASPQNLDEIVGRYHDDRIRYFKNCGALHVVDNWNKCLAYAKGDYVICMGDDDKLKPCCLEEYAKLINKYPNFNVYHALTEMIDENSNFMYMQEARPEREGVYSMMYGRLKNGRVQYIGDWLFKTDWLRSNGGYVDVPMAWGSDDLTAYAAAQDNGVANSRIPMFQYRINSQTISKRGNASVKLKALRMTFHQLHQILSKECNDDLKEKYRLSCLKIIDSKLEERATNTIMTDLLSRGKIKGLAWWFVHRKNMKVANKQVFKAFVKSINK